MAVGSIVLEPVAFYKTFWYVTLTPINQYEFTIKL